MKAVGYITPGSIDRVDALIDVEIGKPEASGQDLLVRVQAVAANPVDFKIRSTTPQRAMVQRPWDGTPLARLLTSAPR